jgi:putative membrane-bound dehydrogenase-like protein
MPFPSPTSLKVRTMASWDRPAHRSPRARSHAYTLALWLAACWIVAGSSATLAQQPATDSLDRDYAVELPRIPPTEPSEALAKFHVAPGFRIEQVAAEPLLADPVAICFDENARMFVCEMRGYSENRDEGLSRIRVLTDDDGDGRFDRSETFAEGLRWPTALFYTQGKLLVVDAPDILLLADSNGDGRADQREVLYSGLGTSNVQGLANSLQWSLANRILLSLSSTGAELTSPKTPDAKPVSLRGRDLALDPRTWQFAPISGGAQHGMSQNDWGDRFVSSNSDHLQQVMYEDHYLARNPYLAAPSARRSIAADGPQADVFRTSPVEPWRIVRTRLRAQRIVPGVIEGGGRPAGYFTGATGVTIYRGDAWPGEWQGLAIVGDVGSNLVHRKRLAASGVGFVGTRVDEASEFVSSSDIWFRPVQFANAPDGSLYILDMYREVIEHPASLPPIIKQHLDLTSGRDRGRIYRVVPEKFSQPPLPKLTKATAPVLVALLQHPNAWHRETAARLIYERQDQAAIGPLVKLASESELPLARLHALYALDGLGALSDEVLVARLADKHPRVREHAARLAESKAASSAAVQAKLLALASDPELRVRYQAAFSLGQLPASPQRAAALVSIAKRDADDGYVRVAVQSSLAEGAGEVLAQLAADREFRASAAGRDFLASLAAQIGRQQRADDVANLLQALGALAGDDPRALQTIVAKLGAAEGSPLARQVAAATGGRAEELMKSLLAEATRVAADESATEKSRIAAVQQLRLGRLAESEEVLAALLAPAVPAELQSAALATLGSYSEAEVAPAILAAYPALSPRLKSQAADLLISRPAWTLALVKAIEAQTVSLGDVDPARIKLLAEHPDERVRTAAAGLLAASRLGARSDVVDGYREVLALAGNAAAGKEVFTKVCAACHKVGGVGHEIGPNLAAMKARGSEAILVNVLDPNREVNPQYLNYVVRLADGRTLTGMIAAESATSLSLRRADNQQDTVLRIEIDQLKSSGQSLMPEGMERQIDRQQMADLLEYLRVAE